MATETQSSWLQTESLTGLHWLAILLAAITGVIHLWLAVSFIPEPMGWAFLVAGVGFIGAIVAFVADYRRRLLYLLGIPFTGGQIPAWYVVNAPDFSPLGLGDKAVQVVLIVVLVILYRRES
jgi:hypothetical protein